MATGSRLSDFLTDPASLQTGSSAAIFVAGDFLFGTGSSSRVGGRSFDVNI